MRSKRLRLILFFAAFCAALSFARTTPQQADLIVVFKKDHLLKLYSRRQVIRTYKVALGTGGVAPKEKEGDGRVPEGRYMIDRKNAASHYHKALHISYPNVEDRARAARLHAAPGGDIMIHGL